MKKNVSSRAWGLIVPADWPNAGAILSKCKEVAQRYYIILHDKDVREDGTPKTPHYHVLCKYANPRQLGTVQGYFSEFSQIAHNSHEKICNLDGAKRYLVHYDQPEKTPYDANLVETNDLQYKDVFAVKLANQDEITEILDQYDMGIQARNAREFCEGFRDVLQHMSPYQKLMAIRGLRKDYREEREAEQNQTR